MKINKLFHWLYAFLMFLPVFFIAGRTLYTIFNENAKDSYSGLSIGEYEVVDNLVSGEDYTFNKPYSENFQFNGDIYVDITNFSTSNTGLENFYLNNADSINRLVFTITTNSGSKMELYNDTTYLDYWTIQPNVSLFIEFTATANVTLTDNTNIRQYTVINSTLDNAFEYSVNQLNESPLFAWATESFLAEPITYITDLFNMPSTSPVITLFSYWLTISLCWLVFDLVMYVPLLAHRWLDKGGIS